jgi:hypothetical protein
MINVMRARKYALGKGVTSKDIAHAIFRRQNWNLQDTSPDAMDAAILALGGYKELKEGEDEASGSSELAVETSKKARPAAGSGKNSRSRRKTTGRVEQDNTGAVAPEGPQVVSD